MKWPTKKLGEVCEINPTKGKLKDATDAFTVSFVPMAAVDEHQGRIVAREVRTFGEVRKGFTNFRDDDVLLAKITPCMENGKVAIAESLENGIGFGSTEFHVIRPSEKVLARWIFYSIHRAEFREVAKKNMTGTAGQRRLPASFLVNYKIPLPPIAEQQRIVAMLDEADRLRKIRKQANDRMAAFLPALFLDLFGDPQKNPKGWEAKNFLDVCDFEGGTQPPKKEFVYEPREGYVRFIQIRDFDTDNNPAYIPDAPKWKRCTDDDVLIARYGASLGRILRGKSGAYNVALVRTKRDVMLINRDYLYWFLKTDYFQMYLKKVSHRAAQAGFNKNNFSNFDFILPPLALQQKFAALAADAEKEMQKQSRATARIEDCFQSLLAQAFQNI